MQTRHEKEGGGDQRIGRVRENAESRGDMVAEVRAEVRRRRSE